MIKKNIQRVLTLTFLILATASMSFGQFNIEPAVSEIGNQQNFVIVIKEYGSIMAKVLMQDGNASDFDFDPNNLGQYPTWIINRLEVERGPNVSPLYYIYFQCTNNQEYFAIGNKGENKMITQKEFDKFKEKDTNGKFKYDVTDMYHFLYSETVEDDGKYIHLAYNENKNGIAQTWVKMKSWAGSQLKLVLVKI